MGGKGRGKENEAKHLPQLHHKTSTKPHFFNPPHHQTQACGCKLSFTSARSHHTQILGEGNLTFHWLQVKNRALISQATTSLCKYLSIQTLPEGFWGSFKGNLSIEHLLEFA